MAWCAALGFRTHHDQPNLVFPYQPSPFQTVGYILSDPASPTINIAPTRDTVEEDQREKQLQDESNPWPTVPVSHGSPMKGSTRVKPRGISSSKGGQDQGGR